MNYVEPIRDLSKLNKMKNLMKRDNRLKELTLFIIGLNTGLRISDILSVKWKELINENGQIVENLYVREKKTGKGKKIRINATISKALLTLRKQFPNDSYIFQSNSNSNLGEPWTRQYPYGFLNDYANRVGIREKIGTHSLRKSFGYHSYKAGIDITLLQYIFNHSAPSITLRYIGITQQDIDDVYVDINL